MCVNRVAGLSYIRRHLPFFGAGENGDFKQNVGGFQIAQINYKVWYFKESLEKNNM